MDKLKVGILGLRRGHSHLRNFLLTDGAEVIGAADRVLQYRDKAAATAAENFDCSAVFSVCTWLHHRRAS